MTHAAPWLTATAKLFAIAPTALFKIICHCPRRTIHLTPMRVCVCGDTLERSATRLTLCPVAYNKISGKNPAKMVFDVKFIHKFLTTLLTTM